MCFSGREGPHCENAWLDDDGFLAYYILCCLLTAAMFFALMLWSIKQVRTRT